MRSPSRYFRDPEQALQRLKALRVVQTWAKEGAEDAMKDLILEFAGEIAAPLAALRAVSDYEQESADRDGLKKTVRTEVDRLDAAMKKYDAAFNAAAVQSQAFRVMNEAIDRYCTTSNK